MAATMTPWVGEARALELLDAALVATTADHVEISLASRVANHTRYAGDRVHQAQSIIECQIMVRAVVGAGSARVAVSGLHQIEWAVRQASDLARARDGARDAEIPYAPAQPRELGDNHDLWSLDTEHWDVAARSYLAGRVMAAGREAGGVVNGNLTAAVTELAVVNSAGVRAHGVASEAGFSATVRIGDASSYVADLGRDVGTLDVESRVMTAVDTTAKVREIVPVPDGVHDVVFGGLATGELVGFVPEIGFTASAVRARVGLVAQHPGELVMNDAVSIRDDASARVGLPFPFDFEGSPKATIGLIEHGHVGAPVSDLASCAVTGGLSTGHAYIGRESSPVAETSNLVMATGAHSEAELIAGVERGLYVQRLWYNRLVDTEAGTVVGTSRDGCFLIEDGVLTKGLAGARFNESVIDAMRRVDGVGDTWCSQPIPNVWNGAISAPAIRVRGFRFGAVTRGSVTP